MFSWQVIKSKIYVDIIFLLSAESQHRTNFDAIGVGSEINLHNDGLEECVEELSELLQINWLCHPFTQCLLCNQVLDTPKEATIKQQVPSDVQAEHQILL